MTPKKKTRIVNIYAPQNSLKIHETKTELKGEIDHPTIIDGDFNTSFSLIYIATRLKINK